MNAIPYETPEQEWDGYEGEDDGTLAFTGRRRRRFWGAGSAALIALLVGAIGFYAGVRVEKGQVGAGGSPSGSALTGGGLAGAGTRAGAAGGGAGGGGAGLRALVAGGAGGAAGNSSFGTVSTIAGKTIYITDFSGNTIAVKLSSVTKVTKSVGVSRSALRPGDTVIVQGLKGSGGTIQATSVSDSGARGAGLGGGGFRGGGAGGGGAGGASGGGGGAGGGSVNSLFGGG